MRIRSAAHAGGRRGGAAATGTARSAAGFVAGVGCALLLAWWHQRHAGVLVAATASRSLPGERPAGGGGVAGAGAAVGQGGSQLAAQHVAPSVVLPNLDALPYLMVSFGNAAYFELAHNWAKSVQAIGAPFLIAGACCSCRRVLGAAAPALVPHAAASTLWLPGRPGRCCRPAHYAAAPLSLPASAAARNRLLAPASPPAAACTPACTCTCSCACACAMPAAFDDAMLGLCAAAGLPCARIQFGGAQDFRGDFKAFRAMGAVKVGVWVVTGA